MSYSQSNPSVGYWGGVSESYGQQSAGIWDSCVDDNIANDILGANLVKI